MLGIFHFCIIHIIFNQSIEELENFKLKFANESVNQLLVSSIFYKRF